MIAAATLAIALGLLLVRLGWGGRRALAWLGWGLAAAGLASLTARDGAWGMAIGSLVAMLVALLLVLLAGWRSPPRARRAVPEPPSVTLPRRWQGLARRVAVFVLAVPIGFAAALWCAFGAQALARGAGAAEADVVALALIVQPVAWSIILALQMLCTGPARMIAAPAAAALIGTLMWSFA